MPHCSTEAEQALSGEHSFATQVAIGDDAQLLMLQKGKLCIIQERNDHTQEHLFSFYDISQTHVQEDNKRMHAPMAKHVLHAVEICVQEYLLRGVAGFC